MAIPTYTDPIEDALHRHFTVDPTAQTPSALILATLRAHGITNPFAVARAAHRLGWVKNRRGYRGIAPTPEPVGK